MADMTRVEEIVKLLHNDLADRNVLEVACGCAQFSICAGKIARKVCCIDIDDSRLLSSAKNTQNVVFSLMDATNMSFCNDSFDTVVIYNAIGHLKQDIATTIDECLRVVCSGGIVYVISSFLLDKQVISENLVPLLEQKNIMYKLYEDKIFHFVQIKK